MCCSPVLLVTFHIKGGFILAQMEDASRQESLIRKQEGEWMLALPLVSAFHSVQGPSPWDGATHIQAELSWVRLSWKHPHQHMQRLYGDFKTCQFDSED